MIRSEGREHEKSVLTCMTQYRCRPVEGALVEDKGAVTMYLVPRDVTPCATTLIDLVVLEFKLKQKKPLQKHPRVRLHMVCFLATGSQYRINYVADYDLEYHSVKSFVRIVFCLDANITHVPYFLSFNFLFQMIFSQSSLAAKCQNVQSFFVGRHFVKCV